jgi:tyrosyl-DNA phosphodiesterase 2
MDKILFCSSGGGGGLRLLGFARFGMDVVMEGSEEECGKLMEGEGLEKPWVTDHLGVRADFVVGEETRVEEGAGGEGNAGKGVDDVENGVTDRRCTAVVL